MMKKILLLAVSLICISGAALSSAAAATAGKTSIEVILNGKRIAFTDARPITTNGRVLVPLRVVSENLGAKVDYRNGVVAISQDAKAIKLTIGSQSAVVNGESIALDSAPYVKSSRVFVPLRFVSEQLGQTVEWDGVDQYVWIGEKTAPEISTVVTGKPVEDYKYLYSKNLLALTGDGITRTKVWDVQMSQLPIKVLYGWKKVGVSEDPIWDSIVYSLSVETIANKQYLKLHYSGRGHTGLTLVSDDGIPRGRGSVSSLASKDKDGSYIEYFYVTESGDELRGDKNWQNFGISDVKYIQLNYDSFSYVLLRNPYYKG